MYTPGLAFNPGLKSVALAGGEAICALLSAQLRTQTGTVSRIMRLADFSADCEADLLICAAASSEIEEILPSIALLHSRHPFTPILAAFGSYSDSAACRAFRAGASEVVPLDQVNGQIERWRWSSSSDAYADSADTPCPPEMTRWIGQSSSARHLRSWIPRVAATDCNVLVTGETGSGKELVADLIHSSSRRSRNRLVCINCAAVPETLLESELFGHERGSFTGAITSREGAFEAANGGTIFLDEIGEMTQLAQAKILRALETRQVQRVGSSALKQLDVRIVAATNQRLDALVAAGRFRKDLFYRLKVAHVELPPLRECREDISGLLKHFLILYNRKYQARIAGFSADSMRKLLAYDWPGNVRELRNLVELLYIEPLRTRVEVADLPLPGPKDFAARDRQHLTETLASVNWNKSAAARVLKWSRMTLYRKMAKYEIFDREDAAAIATPTA